VVNRPQDWRFALRVCTAAFLCLTACPAVHAADDLHSEDAVEAAYLYRFIGYVEWPKDSAANHPFTIAVFDAPRVAEELRRLLPGHPINKEIAQVREVRRMAEVDGAQILFVGAGHSAFLRDLRETAGRSILVVTDDDEGLALGSVLNFVTIDSHVRFEISLTAADRLGLKISSELLSVALRVHGGRRQSGGSCISIAVTDETDGPCTVRVARHPQHPAGDRSRLQAAAPI